MCAEDSARGNSACARVTDWWAVIFNPSFPYRLVHMVLASYLTTAFVVGAVGAYHLLKTRALQLDNTEARTMFSMAMWMAALVAPLQILAGDLHGLNTLEHQPAKIAAMEGHFETRAGAPLILFGMPNQREEQTDYAISIPKLGSLILTHDPNGVVRGLKEWPEQERPPVAIVFWSFRVMMAIGFAMLGIGAWSLVLRYRRRLHDSPWMHRAVVLMGPSGFAALLAGWFTTEVGRQPYTVYGLMTTAESVSAIAAPAVAASLGTFVVVYFAIFGAGTFYIVRLMRKPAAQAEPDLPADKPTQAAGLMPGPVLSRATKGAAT